MLFHKTPGRLAQAFLAATAMAGLAGAGCDDRGSGARAADATVASGGSSGLAAAPAEAPLRRAPDGRPLTLTFTESFDILDPSCGQPPRWRSAFGDGEQDGVGKRTLAGNGERQVYIDSCFLRGGKSPFQRRPGGLDIVADRAAPGVADRLENHRFTSGVLTTQPSFNQRYGYFEARVRLPRGKGLWPAFWMLPADLSWPPEIDVVESVGDPGRAVATVHARDVAPEPVAYDVPSTDSFHVFAVSWDPRSLVWYLDGREVARKPTPRDADKPMFLVLNLAVGGHWPGDPDEATPFPARFSIDWVRAYQFATPGSS